MYLYREEAILPTADIVSFFIDKTQYQHDIFQIVEGNRAGADLRLYACFYIMRYMLRPPLKLNLGEDTDEDLEKAVEVIIQYDRASASLLQRRLSIGYARAARQYLPHSFLCGPCRKRRKLRLP